MLPGDMLSKAHHSKSVPGSQQLEKQIRSLPPIRISDVGPRNWLQGALQVIPILTEEQKRLLDPRVLDVELQLETNRRRMKSLHTGSGGLTSGACNEDAPAQPFSDSACQLLDLLCSLKGTALGNQPPPPPPCPASQIVARMFWASFRSFSKSSFSPNNLLQPGVRGEQ